ncbi:MAG: YfcE family phosphodiesterase [Ruminococcaceae bacterium]|nr:YfcE family phosphodiesterase [Oscillospiraceae bacterium]
MTLLVLSDSHGRVDRISRACELNKGARAILFLGDGLSDLGRAELCGIPVVAVRGNCDFDSSAGASNARYEHIERVGEYNILLTHGHLLGVKEGRSRAVLRAAQLGADILLYGHTHEPEESYIAAGTDVGGVILDKPLRVFNPGSIGRPRGRGASFGVITIRGRDILLSHGEL